MEQNLKASSNAIPLISKVSTSNEIAMNAFVGIKLTERHVLLNCSGISGQYRDQANDDQVFWRIYVLPQSLIAGQKVLNMQNMHTLQGPPQNSPMESATFMFTQSNDVRCTLSQNPFPLFSTNTEHCHHRKMD